MHNITAGQKHAILRVSIALNSTEPAEITDGLNELFNNQIADGFVADYKFHHADSPLIVKASDEPEEGELFVDTGAYVVLIENEAGQKIMVNVESDSPLDSLPLPEARQALSQIIALKANDQVFIQRLDTMSRLTLQSEI